jgi:hypothetical protein
MSTRTVLLIGAECEENCEFQDSVRKTGACLRVALSAEEAVEMLASEEIDEVLIHQDCVGFGNILASEIESRYRNKPQSLVCQECTRNALVPFGSKAFSSVSRLTGNYLLYTKSPTDEAES